MNPLDALASHFYEVDYRTVRPRFGAVYLLVLRGEVMYVGQTTDLDTRIAWHAEQAAMPTKERDEEIVANYHCKPFDRALAMRLRVEDLDLYEGALIRALWPRYNRRAPIHSGRDNAVLAALGLAPHDDEKANARAWSKSIYTPRGRVETRPAPAVRDGHALQRARAQRLFAGIESLLAARTA